MIGFCVSSGVVTATEGRPYTDAETGFVYLRARYIVANPATGQFISRDPLGALTGSAYGYVDVNPLIRPGAASTSGTP